MESIFHEKQDGSLCAQHCLNALLQGEYFTAVELATLAQQMDEAERQHMAEAGVNSEEYKRFLQQPSSNMDDSGYFSIQVIASALEVWSLELIPYNSQHPSAVEANASPINQTAFICNYRDHWFTVRKLGKQWFNLNSLLSGPELISDTYLAMFLAQLQQEGYSIFIVQGFLPECEADNLLRLVPVVQLVKPRLLAEIRPQQDDQTSNTSVGVTADKDYIESNPDDEDHQLDEAVKLSLQEYQSNGQPTTSEKYSYSDSEHRSKLEQACGKTSSTSGTINSDHNSMRTVYANNQTHQNSSPVITDDLSEEAMLEAALKMSMEQETG